MKKAILKGNSYYNVLVLIVLSIGFLVRFVNLGNIPGLGALNQDEAYGGYEAWSMLNFGHDSRGYSNFPVYLKTWGSGMNLLPSVLMIPFIKLFDLTPLSIRFPQAFLGFISLCFFYLFVYKISKNYYLSLISLFILSITPWHVMLSRWGLESNYFPGFLLLSIYFLVKARDNLNYIFLSMLLFGLALYTYASPWVIMPFLIIHLVYFLILNNNIRNIIIRKNFIKIFMGFFILFITALPLLVFVFININVTDEFSIKYISFPRLSYFRSDDVSLSFYTIRERMSHFFNLCLFQQADGVFTNNIVGVGIYYRFSSIFLIIGFVLEVIKYIKSKVSKIRHQLSFVMLIWFFYGFVLSMLIDININRINIIHLPCIYFISQGIVYFCSYLKRLASLRFPIFLIIAVYMYNFLSFIQSYFYSYGADFYNVFDGDLKQVVEYLKDTKKLDKIIHMTNVCYPNLLFYLKYPADKYIKTANFIDDNSSFQALLGFENFDFTDFTESDYNYNDIYITVSGDEKQRDYIKKNAKRITQIGKFVIGDS